MRTTTLAPEEARAAHTQAGRKIEYLSIAWTTLEAVAGIIAGVLAGSVALIGFGVDSAIEVASSIVLLWRLVIIRTRNNVRRWLIGLWASGFSHWQLIFLSTRYMT